jgi:hypothetical protein
MNSTFQNSNETVDLAQVRVAQEEIRRLQTKLSLAETDSDRQTVQENVSGDAMAIRTKGVGVNLSILGHGIRYSVGKCTF